MPSFQIQTYTVTSFLERFTDDRSPHPTRVLQLTSTPAYHGIVNHATFAFSRQFDAFTEPVAGYLTLPVGYEGVRIAGWFPLQEFSYYYDILRSESPVFLSYEVSSDPRLTNYIARLGLYTHAESTGEGPIDGSREEYLSSVLSDIYTNINLANLSTQQ